MKKKQGGPILLWYFFFAVILAVFLAGPWLSATSGREVPYSQFLDLLNKNQIEEVTVRSDTIEAKLKAPVDGQQRRFSRHASNRQSPERLRRIM